jgi:hypothetical protein
MESMKSQIPIFNDQNSFGISNFGHCDLFGICDLSFGISFSPVLHLFPICCLLQAAS